MPKPTFNRTTAERRAERDIAAWFASRRAAWSRQAATGRIPRHFTDAERDALAAILLRRALETAGRSWDETRNLPELADVHEARTGTAAAAELGKRVKAYADRTARIIISDTVGQLGSRTALQDRDLRETRIQRLFGRTRAEAISINITTDSRSAGQLAVGVLLGDEVEYDWEWVTEDDLRVCQICDSLNGTGRAVWSRRFPFGPKAHPRCRCDLTLVVKTKRRGRS